MLCLGPPALHCTRARQSSTNCTHSQSNTPDTLMNTAVVEMARHSIGIKGQYLQPTHNIKLLATPATLPLPL
jgi:hypothetical protein